MNIFFLHMNQQKNAEMYVDSHVIKIILEIAQMMSTAHHVCNETTIKKKYIPKYKITHKNHPVTIWIRTSLSNYLWTYKMGKELCKEYTFRYGKVHKCERIIDELGDNLPDIDDIGITKLPQALPDVYKDENDAIYAYQQYYFFEKRALHKWKKRDVPKFIKEFLDLFN